MQKMFSANEMSKAVTELFEHRDSSYIVPMLSDDFSLKLPMSLPYGGELIGPEAFENFFQQGVPGGSEVWKSFNVHLDRVIEASNYFLAQLTNTAVPKSTGKEMQFNNLWLFESAGGHLVSAQLYADTAAAGGQSAN